MKRALLLIAVAVLAVQTKAQCTLNITKDDVSRGGKIYVLKWNAVPGAGHYIVEEIRVNSAGQETRVSYRVDARSLPQLRVSKHATESIVATYRVIAIGTTELCTGEIQVQFGMDETLARITRRSTIPLVGSTPGRNGALFKTSLRLRSENLALTGRLVFHPLGVPGSDNDPSIRYEFPVGGGVLEWDDIVAEFGVTGLGSLDIVPDPLPWGAGETYRVPLAEVRLFNVADGGTFGTIEPQTQAIDFLQGVPGAIRGLSVIVPGPELRLNMGVRSLEAAAVAVTVRRGGKSIFFRNFTMARDQLTFSGAAEFAGTPLEPGDEVHVGIHAGSAIPMYSLTDNRTNDPALYYPPTRTLLDLSYFELP